MSVVGLLTVEDTVDETVDETVDDTVLEALAVGDGVEDLDSVTLEVEFALWLKTTTLTRIPVTRQVPPIIALRRSLQPGAVLHLQSAGALPPPSLATYTDRIKGLSK